MAREKLTARQQRFVEEYLCDSNATQAAIRAGYSGRAARQAGSAALSNPAILARVRERQAELAGEVRVTQAVVIRGLLTEAQGTGSDTSSRARVSAWVALAKHLGIESPKETKLTLETLNRVLEQLGVAVARHVKDHEILAAIEREWGTIQLG